MLDWDIKLDTVSIKDNIESFSINESKGAYVRELTLVPLDIDFDTVFDFTALPTERVEVLTKNGVSWVSQGTFFIEKPSVDIDPDSKKGSVWGRSSTAKLGEPFASKVSRDWDSDTTCYTIIQEMATLCGVTVELEIDDYPIVAGSYVVDNLYPIDVIIELAGFIAGFVGTTLAGNLIIRPEIFHPSSEDHTVVDLDIIDMSESTDIPDFGNRIRVSANGVGSGYSISLVADDDSDCLNSDGVSQGTLLAFVTDTESEPINDVIVDWTIGSGLSTLETAQSRTGSYLLSNKKHNATNYYTVTVEYPVSEVLGIWAYADSGYKNNFWEPVYGEISGSTLTVRTPFSFCDQLLKVSYITSGCAINKVIAGSSPQDVIVTSDIQGASDNLTVKIGNPCACGSSLNVKRNPTDSICLGTSANILIWATLNNMPATGYPVKARLTEGCGSISSENKTLSTASILNEAAHTFNVVTGVTQVNTDISIAPGYTPKVYLETDIGKSTDLYSSYSGKTIDLNGSYATGTKVIIDYQADGATLIAWLTTGETKDCDAEVTVTMADGTEEGGRTVVKLGTSDCTSASDNTIPNHSDDQSSDDPEEDDQSNTAGFGGDEEEPGPVDPCLTTVMDRILNSEDAVSDDDRDAIRFGVKSTANCPDEGFDCPCSELCNSEMHERGNTYDHDETIHEEIVKTYEDGTPEYYEAFETLKQTNLAECESNCEQKRSNVCSDCKIVSGPATLAPGEMAEYVCGDGISGMITMPTDACGTQTFTVGCCTFQVRSTVGQWNQVSQIYQAIYGSGVCGTNVRRYNCTYNCVQSDPNEAGVCYTGSDWRICGDPAFKSQFDDIYCLQYKSYEHQASGLCDLSDCQLPTDIEYYALLGQQNRMEWECS